MPPAPTPQPPESKGRYRKRDIARAALENATTQPMRKKLGRTDVPQTTSTRGLPIQTKRVAGQHREYGVDYEMSDGSRRMSDISTRPNFGRTQASKSRPYPLDEQWGDPKTGGGTIYAATSSARRDASRGDLSDVVRKRPGTKLERDNGVTDRYGQVSYQRSRNRGYEPPMRQLPNSNARSASRAASVAATQQANRKPARGS